jgi:type II secretion system protein G
MSHIKKGFTLIELLIVIAIILILIAIALPNFLEAQIRARVVKAKSEMKSIYTGMESYYIDFKIYPEESEQDIALTSEGKGLLRLTSPIAYMTSIPEDPFGGEDRDVAGGNTLILYEVGGVEAGQTYPRCGECCVTWCMFSKSPWGEQIPYGENPHFNVTGRDIRTYNPTNGTSSRGNIFQWGGDGTFIGVGLRTAGAGDPFAPQFQFPLPVDGDLYSHKLPPSLR